MSLFDPNCVYPSDATGPYTELKGVVLEVGDPNSTGNVSVKVQTEKGVFTGYYWAKYPPKVGYLTTIRIYNAGGGWYPDNRIIGWCVPSTPPETGPLTPTHDPPQEES